MDPEALAKYWHLKTEEDEQRWDSPDPTLTYDESEVLRLLAAGDGPYARIEQERIPIDNVEKALDGVLATQHSGAPTTHAPLRLGGEGQGQSRLDSRCAPPPLLDVRRTLNPDGV